ncbi:MAG: HAMP domain-containing sensor histidine kinase [Thermoanaerobaculia bacterium]|nr:HAMP domain-containing sensor histidine kinase [Thermoanaerobaculia bacterium]
MTLATRITAGNLTVVAILLGLAGYFLRGLEELGRVQKQTTESMPLVATGAQSLQLEVREWLDFVKRGILFGAADHAERTRQREEEIRQALPTLRRPIDDPAFDPQSAQDFVELLKVLADRWRILEKAADLPELPTEEKARERQRLAWEAELAAAAEPVQQTLGDIAHLARELARRGPEKRFERAQRRAIRTSLWAAVIAAVLALAVALGVLRSATKPLQRLARGTRAIASGDLSYRVEPEGSPEVRGLARDFNAMADRLYELDRLKSDFVSSVSHDLKAPLASIAETTSLMLEGLPGPLTPKQTRLLSLNLESARRLGQMIENLLDLSRIEAGALALQFTRLDLAQLAGQAVDQLRGLIDKKGLTVSVDGAPDTGVLEGDAAALRRALGNLVANAVSFSPTGGQIEIQIRPRARESVEILVADQGPGVPDSEKERIFQRFYRSQHGARGPGTGIGLAIARAIVEAHGGVLWVRDGVTGGSVFSCLLPRSRRAPLELS